MTDQELADLNAALLPSREVVLADEHEGTTVYWLCRMVKAEKISDPTAFALPYGVVIA